MKTKTERDLNKTLKRMKKVLSKDKRKVVVCKDCGQLIDRENERCVVEFDISTQSATYICEKCNDKFTKELEERNRLFKQNCPKHEPCNLWCEACEDKETCSFREIIAVKCRMSKEY